MAIPIDPTMEHIGDGVYASYDGWHVALRANDHRNPVVVCLEPDVIRNLIAYYNRMSAPRDADRITAYDLLRGRRGPGKIGTGGRP